MLKRLEIGVIGLGKFGLQLGATLAELGHRVIGVDKNPELVRAAQNVLSQVYEANAVEKAALTQLHFQDLDTVAVSVGDSMDTSIMVTLNLQEIGVKNILVKAINPAHRKVLERIGAHHVVQPEVDVAVQIANRLHNPGMLDLLPIGKGVLVQELIVDKWAGKSLIELNLRNESGVLVAAIRHSAEQEYTFVPNPSATLEAGDRLLLIGAKDAVLSLKA